MRMGKRTKRRWTRLGLGRCFLGKVSGFGNYDGWVQVKEVLVGTRLEWMWKVMVTEREKRLEVEDEDEK